MPVSRAELTSIATTLGELTERIANLADASVESDESLTRALMEVERDLRRATRQLDAITSG